METKYIKDFAIALVVIFLLAYLIHDYYLMKDVQKVPEESKFKRIALDDELLARIHNIEGSIKERKQFIFTVEKDPLEQNLIVKTKQDLVNQWKEKVESMVRLQSTLIAETGEKFATISHEGVDKVYRIGENFILGKIMDIRDGEITYKNKNKTLVLRVEKLPEKPKEIVNESRDKTRDFNW